MAGATTAAASSVTVNGSPANVYSDHTFALDGFTPIDGTNTFTAVATDALGRGDTNTVVVNLPAAISFAYDDNGNMTTNGTRVFEYDDENQLIRITEPNAWRSVFTYDGKMRRRERRESVWDGAHWVSNLLVRYVYDGNLVLQERQYDPRLTTTVPQRSVTYTRGRDLSGGLQGAGGIGGLLARTDSGFSAQPSVYYHCDNVGNVTALVNSGGTLVGRYWYDPFGNTLALAGAAAEANLYRFSSKEWHEKSGIAYYLYRYYAPNLQRWLNRDPVGEYGGYNLYRFCRNQTTRDCDAFGLKGWPSTCSELFNSGNLNWAKDLARHVIKRIGRYCGAPDVGHYQTIASHCHGVARFIELWQKCQGPLTKAQQSAMTGALAEVVKAATACSKVRPPSEDQIAVEGASATSLQAVFEPLNPPAPDAIAITVPPPIRIPFPIFGW